MDAEIFRKFKGKYVKIGIKPSNFALSGWIEEVFSDCIEFRTQQKTSFLDFDVIVSISEQEGGY